MNDEPLFSLCESCGNGRLATHSIDFQDGGRPFLVCRCCAEDATDRGLAIATELQDATA